MASEDHLVRVHLPLSDGEFGTADERDAVFALEERIAAAVADAGGQLDGDEFGGGEVVLFVYGPDGGAVLDVVRRCLDGFELRPGAYAVIRRGDDRQERVELS